MSTYLYQLSSPGAYRLVASKINYTEVPFNSTVGLGNVNLQLDLSSINYPPKYNLLFYTAESFKSNEVKEFTNWVNIPAPKLKIITSPSNIEIRQGQEQLIPAIVKSTSGFSSDITYDEVSNITIGNGDIGLSFNSSQLHVNIQRIQPPLFRIAVPQQTSLGNYAVPLIVEIREPSVATVTKPIFVNSIGGVVDPKFELSKKIINRAGFLTLPVNLTIAIIPPSSISDQFRDFWSVYGGPTAIFLSGCVGVVFYAGI